MPYRTRALAVHVDDGGLAHRAFQPRAHSIAAGSFGDGRALAEAENELPIPRHAHASLVNSRPGVKLRLLVVGPGSKVVHAHWLSPPGKGDLPVGAEVRCSGV